MLIRINKTKRYSEVKGEERVSFRKLRIAWHLSAGITGCGSGSSIVVKEGFLVGRISQLVAKFYAASGNMESVTDRN